MYVSVFHNFSVTIESGYVSTIYGSSWMYSK